MNLQKTEESQIKLFSTSDKNFQRKEHLMSIPEVLEKLSTKETMIANAAIKIQIKNYPQEQLITKDFTDGQPKMIGKAVTLGKGIARDIGISYWDNSSKMAYPLARFADVLIKFYGELTLEEIKLAFEMLAIGELDEYLPKDRFGNAEKNHFQEFSVEYYCRILNAFKKLRSLTWYKAQQSVPKLAPVVSEKQIKDATNFIIDEIYQAFDDLKIKNENPSFPIAIHINQLAERGLVEIKKATKPSYSVAYKIILAAKQQSKIERSKMIEDYGKKIYSFSLQMEAQRVENNLTIKKYFESLITDKKDIRDFLKKIELHE